MKRLSALLLTGLGVSCIVCSVYAQFDEERERPERRPPEGREGRMGGDQGREQGLSRFLANPMLMERLGITEEQIQTLKKKSVEIEKKLIDLQAEMKKAEIDRRELMSAKDIDEAALMASVEKLGKLRIEVEKLRIKQKLLVKSVLTPEQMAQVTQMMQRRKGGGREQMMRERRERMERHERDGEGGHVGPWIRREGERPMREGEARDHE